MRWLPKTRMGKISAWTTIGCFAAIHIQYWIALAIGMTIILPGFLLMLVMIISGITSFVVMIKHKDRSIFGFIAVLGGLFGILFVLGEIFFPH